MAGSRSRKHCSRSARCRSRRSESASTIDLAGSAVLCRRHFAATRRATDAEAVPRFIRGPHDSGVALRATDSPATCLRSAIRSQIAARQSNEFAGGMIATDGIKARPAYRISALAYQSKPLGGLYNRVLWSGRYLHDDSFGGRRHYIVMPMLIVLVRRRRAKMAGGMKRQRTSMVPTRSPAWCHSVCACKPDSVRLR